MTPGAGLADIDSPGPIRLRDHPNKRVIAMDVFDFIPAIRVDYVF